MLLLDYHFVMCFVGQERNVTSKKEAIQELIDKDTPLLMGERYLKFYKIHDNYFISKVPSYIKISEITQMIFYSGFRDEHEENKKLIGYCEITTKAGIHHDISIIPEELAEKLKRITDEN